MNHDPCNPLLLILAPPPENPYTGGYLYNKRISESLTSGHIHYRFFSEREETTGLEEMKRVPYLLLDSIYLARREYRDLIHFIQTLHPAKTAFLIHHLPSLDPHLPSSEAAELRNLERKVLAKAQFLVVTSRFMKRELLRRGLAEEKVLVVTPGTDKDTLETRAMTNKKDNTVSLLTVSNWSPLKNQAFLLPVLEKLYYLKWEWVILGAYEPEDQYVLSFQEKARNLGLSERISLEGSLPPEKTAEEMRKAEVFLFPSLQESYGMALAEAMQAGLPVIANRTGGIPELFDHRREGYLCDLGDEGKNTEDWIHAAAALLESAEKRKTMGKEAAKKAKSFPSWEEQGRRLVSMVSEIKDG